LLQVYFIISTTWHGKSLDYIIVICFWILNCEDIWVVIKLCHAKLKQVWPFSTKIWFISIVLQCCTFLAVAITYNRFFLASFYRIFGWVYSLNSPLFVRVVSHLSHKDDTSPKMWVSNLGPAGHGCIWRADDQGGLVRHGLRNRQLMV
jgi:hypothetical protein